MLLAQIPFPEWSPYLVRFGGFGVRWYALAYIVGLLVGWRYVAGLMRRPKLWPGGVAPMAAQKTEDLLLAMALGVILGGRLGFVLLYRPGDYLSAPWNILKTWEGGMSFHGGLIGAILAIILFARRAGASPLSLGDAVACATPIGIFFGRLANFVNAELYGRETDVAWGIRFPIWNDAENTWVLPAGEPVRHPSQLYEAGLEGLLLGLILLVAWRAGALRRPGLCGGIFLAGYASARLFVENFRQMDYFMPGEGYAVVLGPLKLTMGQVYSLPMLAVGLGLILYALRRPARSTAP